MEVGEIRKRIMTMFLVVWVVTAAGQTVFIEAANGSYASNPYPADGAMIRGDITGDNIFTELVFVPGATAVEHTGYFSDDYSKVESRAQDANLGPPPYPYMTGYEYTFWVGNPQVPPAEESLVRGTTYYWCVDETDALGTTYPGDIWEFTIWDYKACCPNPPDGAVVLGPDVLLSWKPGYGVEEHDVYISTDFNSVELVVYDHFNPPPEYLGTVEEPNILVTGLSENTTYYWRVDEIVGRGPPDWIPHEYYKGDVWSFKTAGLIAHWKFDEGTGGVAYDSAGNNDGTLVNGPTWTTGIIDGALDFDGVDDYVDCGNTFESVISSNNKTIMGWANSDIINYPTEGRIITIYKEDGTSGFSILAAGNPATWHGLYRETGDTSGYLNSGIAVVSSQWTHITLVQEGSGVSLYVNGSLVDSASDAVIPNIISPPNASVGAFVYSGGLLHPFEGMLDDVRVYDRALTALEIEELYQSGLPVGQTYHVDGVNGDNTNDGLTRETAFKTIQRGINVADDFDTVLVWPGVYNEEISFWGDAITVKSAADAAIVETDYGYAFSFFSAEGPDTVLSNFVIRNSQYGIYLINGSSPTLRNLTIVNNDFGISAFNGADPDISSCIFWNNYYGDLFRDPIPLEAKYSWLQDEVNEPIAYWKLDEGSGTTAYDSAGTNNGTLYGSPSWVSGVSGKALDFDGVGERDYVLIAGQTGLLGGSQFDDITVEAWFKTSTINDTGPYAAIVADETTDGEFAIAVNEFGNAYGVIYMEGSTGAQLLYGPNATDGEWHNLCLRKDSSEVALFVDVTKCDTVASTGPLKVNQQTHVTLGCKYTTYLSVQFIGIIDEVRIYDRALSAEEIEAIYEAGLSGISYGGPGFVDAAGGDYHLLSERGRYWPVHDVWVLDDVTSPCIDGGDPEVDPSNERMPNGGRINMGAYGNSAYASMSECWSKSDFNCDGIVNFKDFAIFAQDWLNTGFFVPDTTPPAPAPVIITIGAVSSTSLMMTASEAFDESGVQYYFEAQSAGGHDSGWIGARTYTDVGLVPDTTYCYRVKARDKSANHNETIWSPTNCAVTVVLPDTLAPLPDPMQWDPVVDANGYDGRPLEVYFPLLDRYGAYMRAIDADDQAPAGAAPAEVEYYFQCQDDGGFDSGWRTVAAYPNEDDRRTYTVPISQYSGHAYRFRVKARDASDNLNETDWSDWYPAVYRDPP